MANIITNTLCKAPTFYVKSLPGIIKFTWRQFMNGQLS